ncbi:MAG TPA: hypothetical protein VLQ46_00105 [Casimicrobiaceae bacterium]|nr:hypothetical protein [Casimicrobiaceae bacterium]
MTGVPDIPAPLKAVQIARDMLGFDPLWAEAIAVSQNSFVAVLADRPDRFGVWIPIKIAGRPGFIRVEEDGLSGEYRSQLEPDAKRLDIAPLEIEPAGPTTLQEMLRKALSEWSVEPQQAELHAAMTRLADSAFVPMKLDLRGVLSSLAENPDAGVEGLTQRNQQLAADSSQAFGQFELCGRELALAMAFTTLVNTVAGEWRARSGVEWNAEAATILLRSMAWGPNPSSEESLARLLDSLAEARRSPMILACVEVFAAHADSEFEGAKSVGVGAGVSPEEAAERVCRDFGYAMALWSDLHHALRGLLPVTYAGQVLARFLVDKVALPPRQEEEMLAAYKHLDELTVVIMNSLGHAVRMHDPRMRAAMMTQIRQARDKGGERAARAVVRSVIEQQAFYPRAWTRWLNEASVSADP